MKVPLRWLSEFVTVDAPVEEIARRLTVAAGLEVEDIQHVTASFSDVVVAKVTAVEKHPNADRLVVCRVDAGGAGQFSVVCGAPNVRAGMTAALARVGAKLADGTALEAATIRGVRSEGMLCSERELGLSDEHLGILTLPADAPAGGPLAAYLGLEDTVIDVPWVPPNRGDCLSVVGFARELAALFGARLRKPRLKPISAVRREAESTPVAIEIAAAELCPRYAALKMTQVKIGPSPAWMRRRLELCGMRALNNVVDATNYVMLETGQPLHAFDMDKIAAGRIVVRRAGADREFTTLDNVARELRPDDLLIADPEKPLALGGIMGGLNSEVSDSTRTILLESAYFAPLAVARTARRLGLRSEASYRFERGVDRAGQAAALSRVAQLLSEHAAARVQGSIADLEPRPAPARRIAFDLGRMASLLGAELPAREVKRRLVMLGATVTRDAQRRGVLEVTPPSYRSDLNEPADLAEEVARLTGFDDVPATLAPRLFSYAAPNREREFFRATRELMLGAGFTEIDTLAFVAAADNAKFAGVGVSEPLRVLNPLSEELRELRLSLLPGLLQALRFNLNRQSNSFHGFQIAKVFTRRAGIPAECYRLAALSYGDYLRAEIGGPAIKASFFTLKGALETLFAVSGISARIAFKAARLNVSGDSVVAGQPLAVLHPGRSAEITIEGEPAGYLGELHPGEALERGLDGRCAISELDLEKFIAYGFSPRQTIEPPPKFPAVRRDLALVLDREFPADMVQRTLKQIAPELLESIELFDVYEGESIAPGKKSVALALSYRAKDRTLTDEEVNRIHAALVEQARMKLGAELRQ